MYKVRDNVYSHLKVAIFKKDIHIRDMEVKIKGWKTETLFSLEALVYYLTFENVKICI